MQTSQMWGARAQQSGSGRGRACLLAAVLWLSFLPLPLYAQGSLPSQATTPVSNSSFTTIISKLSEVCGRTKYSAKIFGGQKAKSERWPWQASLLFRGRHICGAVLIDKNWVVSAAHCFQRSQKPSNYRVLLGYTQLSSPSSYSRQMTVNMLIFHENYNKFYNQGSNIALLQLHMPVTYNSHILPVCVPDNTTKIPPEKACWITGWGMLRADRFLPAPFYLQDAEVFLMDDKECESFFQPPEGIKGQYHAIKDDMICAGDLTNGKSICQGDSGGPLVCLLHGAWYVIGLASWSASCLEPISSPNIFTKVSYFSNWIQRKKEITPEPDPFLAPPEENAPSLTGWRSQGTVIKPTICTVLLSSQVLLWQLIWLWNL